MGSWQQVFLDDKWFEVIFAISEIWSEGSYDVCVDTKSVLVQLLVMLAKSVECHLHALMCSVSDLPPSCE